MTHRSNTAAPASACAFHFELNGACFDQVLTRVKTALTGGAAADAKG